MRVKKIFILLCVSQVLHAQLRQQYPDFNRFLSYNQDFHQTAYQSDTAKYALNAHQKSRLGPLDNIGLSCFTLALKKTTKTGDFRAIGSFRSENEGKYIRYNKTFINLSYALRLSTNTSLSFGTRATWNQSTLTSSLSTRAENNYNLGVGIGLRIYEWELDVSYFDFLANEFGITEYVNFSLTKDIDINSIIAIEFDMVYRMQEFSNNLFLLQSELLCYDKLGVGVVVENESGISFLIEGRDLDKRLPLTIFGLYNTSLLAQNSQVFNHYELGIRFAK